MSSLQKFNNTLEEFDKEVSKLKSIGEVFQEVRALAKNYEIIVESIKKSNSALEDVLKQHQEFQFEIKKIVLDIEKQYNSSRTDIINLLNSSIEEIKAHQKKFEKSLMEEVELIRKENKQFYRDLEETLRIKLSEHKSEIKQFVEKEVSDLKRVLLGEINERASEAAKIQKRLLLVVIISSVIIIVGIAFIAYKHLK